MADSLLARLGGVTLTQLAYAVAVDTHRHFGAAAEACNVTQPTLSMQLRKLEESLGGPPSAEQEEWLARWWPSGRALGIKWLGNSSLRWIHAVPNIVCAA